jgi:hypothetical protein
LTRHIKLIKESQLIILNTNITVKNYNVSV